LDRRGGSVRNGVVHTDCGTSAVPLIRQMARGAYASRLQTAGRPRSERASWPGSRRTSSVTPTPPVLEAHCL
jgi:hypothetical protein